jgi:hypothetical protein
MQVPLSLAEVAFREFKVGTLISFIFLFFPFGSQVLKVRTQKSLHIQGNWKNIAHNQEKVQVQNRAEKTSC